MTTYFSSQKPGLVTTLAATTLVSGIINLFWGLVASATALGTIIGVICLPFTILPTVLGIFEIIYGAKLLGNPPQPVRPSQTLAILEILCALAGNVFSMIVGILSLVFYNDAAVRDYFAQWNGAPAPATPSPVTPPASVLPEPPTSPETESSEAAPQKEQKPRARKTSK